MINRKAGMLILSAIILSATVALSGCVTTIEPGERGVKVSMGQVQSPILKEGVHFFNPIGTRIEEFTIRQTTRKLSTFVTTKDLQKVKVDVSITYRIPDAAVLTLFKDYQGDTFTTLVQPRTVESLKNVASQYTATEFVQKRELIRDMVQQKADATLSGLADVSEVLVTDTEFSPELEKAIELKQAKEQQKFAAQYELEKAKLEAEATKVKAQAIAQSPELLQQEWINKWDGHLPQTMAGNSSIMVMPKGK